MSGWIGVTIGDVTGIGPEVVLKALASIPEDDTSYLLIGDWRTLQQANLEMKIGLRLDSFYGFDGTSKYAIWSREEDSLPPGLIPGSPVAARAALAWLEAGARFGLQKEIKALVTAPVNKASIIRSGRRFIGQTEFLSDCAQVERTAMMLLGADDRGRWLRVVLVTTHIPLKAVAENLHQSKIELAIELAAEACGRLGLSRARVGVCGLNPHAGEDGEVGREEIEIIQPAVAAARSRGWDAEGPMAADSLFYHAYHGRYDAVVAMYHDQGLVPMKMIGFENGINWTLGLPFIRTSPDHGTAYDIAGQGKADPSSMRAAILLARQLADRTP